MTEELELIDAMMIAESGLRGTGRTTRSIKSLREWAIENPDKKAVMVAHDAAYARQLKRDSFVDLDNVSVMGLGQSQSLRGMRLGALEIEHHAQLMILAKLRATVERLRKELDEVLSEAVGGRNC